jgi:hypothetical protein
MADDWRTTRSLLPKGTRVGRLVTTGLYGHRQGRSRPFLTFECVCDCGTIKYYDSTTIKSGGDLSCGCKRREHMRQMGLSNRIYTAAESKTRTRLRSVWSSMISRCYDPDHEQFPRYGMRGIFVVDEWRESFESFLAWGLANGHADDLTIDRIDNDGPYRPDNCRWADDVQQANNRRSNHRLAAFGQTKTMAEWLRDPRCVVSRSSIYKRLALGMDAEAAISVPF